MPDQTDIQAIEALFEHFEKAIVQNDATMLPRLLCEHATALFTGSSDLVRGREAIVEMWQHHMQKWTDVIIQRHNTLVRIHGDVAWASFYWDGEGTANHHRYRIINERWSVVILWEEGSWKFVHMHTSLPYQNWEAHKL